VSDIDAPSLNTLSREITRKLTRRIVDEQYPPNTKLPTERELAAEFGVTRHVVREALKRLEALGLVTIRQGSGILVEPLQITGGLELMRSLLKREDGSFDPSFLRDLLDFRAQLGQTIMRLAAENRTEEELASIKILVQRRKDHFHDVKRLNEINAELFRLFAQATHNRIYQLILNTVGKIVVEIRSALDIPPDTMAQFQRLLEQIVEAVEQRDPEVAGLLAARQASFLRRSVSSIAKQEEFQHLAVLIDGDDAPSNGEQKPG